MQIVKSSTPIRSMGVVDENEVPVAGCIHKSIVLLCCVEKTVTPLLIYLLLGFLSIIIKRRREENYQYL